MLERHGSRRNVRIPMMVYDCDLIADIDYVRVVLMNYREDGITPFVTIWKHGLN